MPDKPRILITAGKHLHTHAPCDVMTTIVGCDLDYLTAVSLAGGAPLILPALADCASIHAAVAVADGLLLTGGGDIHAETYGEAPHPASRLHDPDRDNAELEVVRQALARGMPILGICRGLQLLNIAHGGTLLQDIPDQVPGALAHNAPEYETITHEIHIDQGTLLARVMHTETVEVNSWHHQAVNTLGVGLRISARTTDGVVEGIESSEGLPVLAVQCHPEACADGPCHMTLFTWLVEEAGRYHIKMVSSE